MALFQNSVLKKYLKLQDQSKISEAYRKFIAFFQDPVIQQNIRESKEEQFQEGFLRELFVKVLGYTLNPQADYNLTTELKNEKGAKKADGAILQDGKALAVIELKGTDTTDLDKINAQAFNYKNNQTGCIYVVTSNFEKLRFFIHNAVEHMEFSLFTLTEEEFKLLWLCLQADSLFSGIPLKAKEESLLEEDMVTRQLYKDYSSFKIALWQNMVKNHPDDDKLMLFRKTQKLLDRFLFVLFAEDKGLLPPNSISKIVEQWEKLKELDEYRPLYERFKKYFGYLNTGWKGKEYEIFAYNGGLFFPDVIIDNIIIDDEVLHPHIMKLTGYDFESEVGVNILGHIFEHSLSEIENITARLEGKEVEKSKTKRKKEGVFYTPKYITKYIVQNTIGKLCEEKRAELGIVDEEYAKGRKNRKKETIKSLDKNLQAYREWLLSITICDPACGSGAFLNQALEFLIAEHGYIDELQAQLLEASLVFQDVGNHILEKNIFGVDINEESVEIAKLSLWLRTAQKGRKLTSLSNNIKCGNSLIDDPEVAGEKAFSWQKEFPIIFEEKAKKAWHVTWVTHDTRTSERMKKYKVRERRASGEMHVDRSIYLENEDAIRVSEILTDIVTEDKLNCLAYNICSDHIHILLVCGEEELTNIVRKLKGKSAQKFKEHLKISKDETFNLWAQKFNKKPIGSEQQLQNTIEYIADNRKKHQLPDINKELQLLVDKMTCTPEHAFRTEYKGGFDVVIGNPPYGILIDKMTQSYYTEHFPLTQYKTNLYILFIERMLQIFNKGIVHFIIPKSLLFNSYYEAIRKELIKKTKLNEIYTITEKVFDDAEVGSSLLLQFMIKQNPNHKNVVRLAVADKIQNFVTGFGIVENNVPQDFFLSVPNCEISVVSSDSLSILKKLHKLRPIKHYYTLKNGLNPGNIKHVLISDSRETEKHKPIIWGKEISRYNIAWSGQYVNYDENIGDNINLDDVKSKEGMNKQVRIDFALRSPELFENKKIVVRKTGDTLISCLDESNYYFDTLVHGIYEKKEDFSLEFLLAVLNSKPATKFYRLLHDIKGKVFAKISLDNLGSFPIPKDISSGSNQLSDKARFLLIKTNEFQGLRTQFLTLLQSKFDLEKLSKKLQNWHDLEFNNFLKELKKAKVQLSLSVEADWMQYFNEQKQKALELKSEINQTDKEIDQMVYDLYGLTEEEIKIVEGGDE